VRGARSRGRERPPAGLRRQPACCYDSGSVSGAFPEGGCCACRHCGRL